MKGKKTIDLNIVHQIDNMQDSFDYQPYKPIKKTTITHDELFNDDIYAEEEEKEHKEYGEENDRKHERLILIAVIIIMMVALIALFTLLINMTR